MTTTTPTVDKAERDGEIRQMAWTGTKAADIAAQYGMGVSTVRKIIAAGQKVPGPGNPTVETAANEDAIAALADAGTPIGSGDTPPATSAAMAKLRKAAAASAERRAKNAADKAKVKGLNAADRAARDAARVELTAAMVAKWNETHSLRAVCEAFPNPETGKARWPMPVKAILVKAGCDVTSTREKFDVTSVSGDVRDHVAKTVGHLMAETGLTFTQIGKILQAEQVNAA